MRIFPERPWVGIGVVVHRGSDILLIKRAKAPNKGRWSLAGGAQSLGETVFDGAKREVLEETGILVQDPKLIDVVDSIHPHPDGRIEYHYTLIEVSTLYHCGTAIAMDDAAAVCWVPIQELDQYDLPDQTKRIILHSCKLRGLL